VLRDSALPCFGIPPAVASQILSLTPSLSLSLSLVCVFAGAAAAAAPSVLEDAAARLQKARTHALTADLAVAITAQQEAEKRAAALEVESKHLKAAAAAADKAAKQSGAQAERYKKTGEDCAAKLSTRDTECVPSVYWSAPAGRGAARNRKLLFHKLMWLILYWPHHAYAELGLSPLTWQSAEIKLFSNFGVVWASS
jgi:hypothetical protein